ncbi:hypothetical protein GCM10009078_37820 [Cupriavidus gilardii]
MGGLAISRTWQAAPPRTRPDRRCAPNNSQGQEFKGRGEAKRARDCSNIPAIAQA